MLPINEYIEHTNLKPFITDRHVDSLVAEAGKYKFRGVCVPPFWVKRAKREIGKENIRLITVAGFPFGYNMTETKLEEIKLAIADGAQEIDVVVNISALKMDMDWVKIDLAKCSKLIHDNGCMLKVIIEVAYLTDSEIVKACQIAESAGADFLKTSSGFATQGALEHKISLMKKSLSKNVGVMACGGIRTYDQVMDVIDAGAVLIGTSSGVDIMKEL
ncbi:MAG: deoxyribose-phosphate aldolase [Cytophagaceae bacterium]